MSSFRPIRSSCPHCPAAPHSRRPGGTVRLSAGEHRAALLAAADRLAAATGLTAAGSPTTTRPRPSWPACARSWRPTPFRGAIHRRAWRAARWPGGRGRRPAVSTGLPLATSRKKSTTPSTSTTTASPASSTPTTIDTRSWVCSSTPMVRATPRGCSSLRAQTSRFLSDLYRFRGDVCALCHPRRPIEGGAGAATT
jgi:hypothetical protein